ncbi:Pyroglutamylated RF-amide peptide receptor [Acropora cervicornis]|uniref:Pyroglutamylated RF-amide peptide receptor n=1 Tax=Acropora cervicornis TaxID=6130 RepID=A0AAD9VEF2_ACRCE|nr:Pyroglutamylated RF-amide peptide receptor [Acropora cervicornis]
MSPEDIAITCCFSVLVLVGSVGNVLVCSVIVLNRTMQTPINYLLLNLAVADTITLTFTSPQYIFIHAFSHPVGTTGDYLCKFITGGNISWIGGVASVFCLVAISLERFYAVTNPYNLSSKFTKSKVKVIIACCWIFTTLFNFPLFFAIHFDKDENFCLESWPAPVYGRINSTAWLIVVGIIPGAIMLVLYSKVVHNLWFKKVTNEAIGKTAVRKARKKVTKVVLTVSAVYAISWFPQLIIYALSNFDLLVEFGGILYITSVVLVAFNSAINPVIYAMQSERFRQHFRQLMCCRRKAQVSPFESRLDNTTCKYDRQETLTIQLKPLKYQFDEQVPESKTGELLTSQ